MASRGSCRSSRAEARADPDSALLWSVPTARSDRAYNWGDSAIAPDAVGQMTAEGLRIPFYFEYELRARHPRGVIARLRPYTRYYHSNEPGEDQPPYPVTRKPQALSMFEWALSLEQERKEEIVGAGRKRCSGRTCQSKYLGTLSP